MGSEMCIRDRVYTLDEALKLYAFHQMDLDIERGHAEEMKRQIEH